MPNSFAANTEYFFEEGKPNLRACLSIAFEAAVSREVGTIVIFTGVGEGPKIAVEEFLVQPVYSRIKLIAVTFPNGQLFQGEHGQVRIEIQPEIRRLLEGHGVPLIRAHLPFNPISAHYKNHGILGQDLTLIGNALGIFGGGMSLCVQAALMSCDAGLLALGEQVISLTSDTAIIVRSAPTERLLTDFIVREILCKPLNLTIAKNEKNFIEETSQLSLKPSSTPELLPPE
jgi:hypothetical protein